jgi:hypothetical protein
MTTPTTTITVTEDDQVTLVNVFTVEPRQQTELVDALDRATSTLFAAVPGFISANLHTSLDGTRVINYAQWASEQQYKEALQRSARAGPGRVCIEETREELGELPEVVGWEASDRRGRAQQDGVGGRDRVVPGGRERDQLAAPIVGVRAAFDEAVGFQLVDDEGCVGGVDAVGLRELAQGHRLVAELEEDLSSAAAETESERLGELAAAVVGFDEPLHEGPGLLDGIG